MRRFTAFVLIAGGAAAAYAQRGGSDWNTAGSDAQRSSWVRSDPKINKQNAPKFTMLWKVKAAAQPSIVLTLERYIGYRGFRSLGFTVGAAGNVTAIDTDLGRIEWQKPLAGSAAAATAACPEGAGVGISKPASAAFPGAAPQGRGGGGFGRNSAARSGVGETGEGAVTIQEIAARAAAAPPMPPGGGRGRGRGPAAPGGYNPFARGPGYVYLLSADGMLHAMYLSNGEEPNPAFRFLPPNASVRGLIVVDNVAYGATVHGCGGTADQVWALDLQSKDAAAWKAGPAGIAGMDGLAFAGDGTVWVATGDGVLMSLESKTLKPKDAYNAGAGFVSSPVVFQHNDKTLVAAATKDGQIHLIDAAAPAAAVAKAPGEAVALASWQDAAGTRWLVGAGAHGITTWKVGDSGGAISLQPGWTHDVASPLAPMIVNGVVFTAAGGSRSTPGVLYALDGATGSELWSSGKTIASAVTSGGISAANNQIYIGSNDGTVYAFGVWMEH